MQLSRSSSLCPTAQKIAGVPACSVRAPRRALRVVAADTGDTVYAGQVHRWLDQEGVTPRTRFDARLAALRRRHLGITDPLDKLLGTGKHTYWELEHGYWGGPSLGDLGQMLFLLNRVTVYPVALRAYRDGLLSDDQLKASNFLLPQMSMLAGAFPKAGIRLAEAMQASAELGCRAGDEVRRP